MPFVQEILCNVRYFAGVNGDVVISSASQELSILPINGAYLNFPVANLVLFSLRGSHGKIKRSSAGLNQLVLRLMERDCTNE